MNKGFDKLINETNNRLSAQVEEDMRKSILNYLLMQKPNDATEIAVDYIKSKHTIKSIISDDNPEMFYYHEGIYIPNAQSKIGEICRDLFEVAYTGHLKNKVVDKIRADTYIAIEDFFSNNYPNLIPLQNGIFDLDKKCLIDFSPEYIFTSKINVYYAPERRCNIIINFFADVLKHETDIDTMQELFGYTLWKCYNYQHAFMFLGNGRNGKGVTISLLEEMLGKKNVKGLSLQQIEKKDFLIYGLIGRYANLCGDLSKKALENTGQFKNLTGQDVITADRKYKESIDFTNFAKLIFACNDLPFSYDDSDGFYDRWIFFDFPYKFVDNMDELNEEEQLIDKRYLKVKDPELKDKLLTQDNISGLFNWALEGLYRLWGNNKFTINFTTEDNRKRWKRQASSFNAFFDDCCIIDFSELTTVDTLKKTYQDYCIKHKLKFEGNRIIKVVLESNGCDKEKKTVHEKAETLEGRQVWCWVGLKLKPEESTKSKKSSNSKKPRNSEIQPKFEKVSFLDNLDKNKKKSNKSIPKDYTNMGEAALHDSDHLIDDLAELDDM